MSDRPLIVTLGFDGPSFALFDAARRRHFPPARNHIPAHLTLFHHLPAQDAAEICGALRDVAASTPPLRLAVTGIRFLGQGSAFRIDCPALLALRAGLAARFADRLTPQDRQRFQPHVTIQNKAPAPAAKALFVELEAGFRPFEAGGAGLLLWHYEGGPWVPAGAFPFAGGGGG